MRALVVFHGHGQGRFRSMLAPGFRHCFVCILDEHAGTWLRLDGLAGLPDLRVDAPGGFDLAGYFRDSGYTVVELDGFCPSPPHQPLMLGTCVGAVKRVLGLRAPFILTPKQLFRHLT